MLQKLKPAMLRFMQKRYGNDDIERRWQNIESQYERWVKEEGDLGGSDNWMSSNMMLCYAMCAFYDAIDRELSKEEFLEFFYDAMDGTLKMLDHIDMNRFENRKWILKLVYHVMHRYEKNVNEKRGNKWGNTWKIRTNPKGSTSGIAYTLDSCPLYEFALKHGYMDVIPYMCESDHLVAKAFHAHLIRHKRLSDGDDACEYWYVGDRSPQAYTDPGSK